MKNLFIFCLVGYSIYWLYSNKIQNIRFPERENIAMYSKESQQQLGYKRIVIFENFDISDYLVEGVPTLMVFSTNMCPGSKYIAGQFDKFVSFRPDIAIREIIIPDNWNSSLLKRVYGINISFTPTVIIYDRHGKVLVKDSKKSKQGNKFFYKWLNHELKEDWKSKNK